MTRSPKQAPTDLLSKGLGVLRRRAPTAARNSIFIKPSEPITRPVEQVATASKRNSEMPAVLNSLSIAHTAIAVHFGEDKDRDLAIAFITDATALYQHTDQYHNAEHMCTVVAYGLRIAKVAGLDQSNQAKRIRLVAAAYHDIGNGKHPGSAGSDELTAIREFLADANDPKRRGELFSLKSQQFISELLPVDRIKVACLIAATVFRDRFCSKERVQTLDYVRGLASFLWDVSAQYGIPHQAVNEFAAECQIELQVGARNLNEAVAIKICSGDGLVIRHADLAGSLTAVDALKNNITNRWEDKFKPHVAGIMRPEEYDEGFAGFINGSAHLAAHPEDANSNFYLETLAQQNMIFFGLGPEVAQFGRGKFARWREAINRAEKHFESAPSGNLLAELYRMISEDDFNVAAATMSQIRERLLSRGFSLENYPSMNKLDIRYADMTIAAITGFEVYTLLLPSIPGTPGIYIDFYEKEKEILLQSTDEEEDF